MADPVAWRVKDFADGWLLCRTEDEARRLAEGAGNLVQALYASPPDPTAAEVEEAVHDLLMLASRMETMIRGTTIEAAKLRSAASLIERLTGKEVG